MEVIEDSYTFLYDKTTSVLLPVYFHLEIPSVIDHSLVYIILDILLELEIKNLLLEGIPINKPKVTYHHLYFILKLSLPVLGCQNDLDVSVQKSYTIEGKNFLKKGL